MKCLMQNARQIIGRFHQIIMLGAGPRNAHRVGFLKRIIANKMRGDLTGDAHHRYGIHQRIRQSRHRIGRTGPDVTSTTPGLPVERA